MKKERGRYIWIVCEGNHLEGRVVGCPVGILALGLELKIEGRHVGCWVGCREGLLVG